MTNVIWSSNLVRLLVCGGRDFKKKNVVFSALDDLSSKLYYIKKSIDCVIHGGATGADTFADKWAEENGIQIIAFPADWDRYGPAAGPIRNSEMLRIGRPDLVYAFPGGKGTLNMEKLAKKAGITVHRIGW